MHPIEVGSKKQLFIDDLVIDEMAGVTRNLNQPAKYAGNPIMIPLYSWEGDIALYGTVWRDSDDHWRMWYQGYGGLAIPSMGRDTSDSPWKGFDASNLLYVIGYATSQNGIHWERSNLGLVDYKGSSDNNIVISDASSPT